MNKLQGYVVWKCAVGILLYCIVNMVLYCMVLNCERFGKFSIVVLKYHFWGEVVVYGKSRQIILESISGGDK